MSGWRDQFGDALARVRAAACRARADWRRFVRVGVVALAVAGFALGGVQLADPLPKADGATPVATSDQPARIAYDALRQADDGDFRVRRYWGNDTERSMVYSLSVESSARRVGGRLTFEDARPPREVYASDAGTWARWLGNGSPSAWEYRPPSGLYLYEHESAVLEDGANVSVVSRNASLVVLRVNDTDTAHYVMRGSDDVTDRDTEISAHLLVAVDAESGHLRWTRYRASFGTEDGPPDVQVTVLRFDRWGETDVRRPVGLPYTHQAVVHDLLNTCERCEADDG